MAAQGAPDGGRQAAGGALALAGGALVWLAHAVLVLAALAGALAAWGYYGYRQMACHPMFAAPDAGCAAHQALAAEHSLALARALLPYNELVQTRQNELIALIVAVLGAALVIALAGAVLRIRRRRRR